MDKAKTRSLINEFSSIKEHAASIRDGISWVDHGLIKNSGGSLALRSRYLEVLRDYLSQAKTLLAHFNSAIGQLSDEHLLIDQVPQSLPVRGYLREIMVDCDKILGYLGAPNSNLSTEENNSLAKFASEAREICEGLDSSYGRNIEVAKEAIENGQFLGGALVLGKIIDYALNQVEGKSIEERIEKLAENGALKNDMSGAKDAVIEANRKAMDYLSNRLDIFPDSSETLSLFGGCVATLSILKAYLKTASEK
ncbi:hypothetical protein IX51_01910 [uncultured archaeon]|nr:hypothetical protein IX51_01910 [uncultured archaeon]HKJ96593.1 hypothetical protein [Thermoplasmataceae archaeon]